jgi:hypothetical protein
MKDEHTKMGRLKHELGTKDKVKSLPSFTIKMYAGSNFLFNEMPFTSITYSAIGRFNEAMKKS